MRHDEAHRSHEMRGCAEQNFALGERFCHQPEFQLLEVTQAPVYELAAAGARGAPEIPLLDQRDTKSAAGRIPGNAHPVDAAADDE
jgi:hypothetical protein